jgi:hypothetical protein
MRQDTATKRRKLAQGARKHLPTHPDGEPHSGMVAQLRAALPGPDGEPAASKRAAVAPAQNRGALYAALPQHPDEPTPTRRARHG